MRLPTMSRWIVLAVAFVWVVRAANAETVVLDFEDLGPSTLDVIPDGYRGFEWRGVGESPNSNMAFYAPGLRSRCSTTGGVFAGGYCNGTVSGDYVAFRGTGGSAATIRRDQEFNFEGAYITSPWNNDEDLVIRGFLDGVQLYRDDFIIGTLEATWLELNYLGIDRVTFRATGGVNAGYGSAGEGVVIDNFTYSEVNIGPPAADAGADQTVDEDDLVTLDGSQSMGALTSYVWSQLGGPTVALDLSDPVHPIFTAPFVGGNTTLTFQLIVGDGRDSSDPDTVDIVVASVNELPVADAGNDSTIKEGATAQLDGSNSFDPESDPITFDWDQVPGTPVTLLPNDAVEKPTFVAPLFAGETLIFKLVVDDGFETSVPSPGADSSFADTVAVTVVSNSQPTADAGSNQTKEEGSVVSLNGSASSDPDLGDSLSFQWTQPGGTTVNLSSATSPTPKFDAPAVAPGGEALTFRLVVTDDDPVSPMSSTPDDVVINVTSINDPPRCDLAVASKDVLLPSNHKMEQISIEGVSDGDSIYNVVTLAITGVTQDEPVSGLERGDSSPDAVIQVGDPADTVLIRRERSKDGNGRVYEVAFTADDGFESCDGVVQVSVPHRRKLDAVDDGQIFDSTQP